MTPCSHTTLIEPALIPMVSEMCLPVTHLSFIIMGRMSQLEETVIAEVWQTAYRTSPVLSLSCSEIERQIFIIPKGIEAAISLYIICQVELLLLQIVTSILGNYRTRLTLHFVYVCKQMRTNVLARY